MIDCVISVYSDACIKDIYTLYKPLAKLVSCNRCYLRYDITNKLSLQIRTLTTVSIPNLHSLLVIV